MALPSNAWRRVHQYAKIAQESNLAPPETSPAQRGTWAVGRARTATR